MEEVAAVAARHHCPWLRSESLAGARHALIWCEALGIPRCCSLKLPLDRTGALRRRAAVEAREPRQCSQWLEREREEGEREGEERRRRRGTL
eukprot:scaffold178405_cov30-Tisochrysis_lutea.AAC.1